MLQTGSVLILGIGNVLWADEGFGVRAVEQLHRHFAFPEHVRLMDGGTQGIYLVQYVRQARILVVFDAVDYGLAPGTLKLIEGDEVPHFMGAKKMSLHQTGFQEVLAMAKMLGDYPDQLLLVGVQPEMLEDFGGSLRPIVKLRIPEAIEAALEWLDQHGVQAMPRETSLPKTESMAGNEIELGRYEEERPSDSAACRLGDERVLRDRNRVVQYRPHPLASETISVDVDHRGKY